MICDTILQNELHEKYLLDRMTDEEKKEYLGHLSSCINCRNEQERENQFIYGLRGAGVRQMKDEMHRQKVQAKSSARKYDWTLIFKAAAVLFIIVLLPGTIFYSDLFDKAAAPEEELVLREIKLYTAEEKESDEFEDNLSAPAEAGEPEADFKTAEETGTTASLSEKQPAEESRTALGAGRAAAPKKVQPKTAARSAEMRSLSARGAGGKSSTEAILEKPAKSEQKESEESLEMLLGAAESRSESRQASIKSISKKQEYDIDGLMPEAPPQKYKMLNFKDGNRSITARIFPLADRTQKYKSQPEFRPVKIHLNNPDSVSFTMYLNDSAVFNMLDSLKLESRQQNIFYLKLDDRSGFEIDLKKETARILKSGVTK